jgi:hypothetical protein
MMMDVDHAAEAMRDEEMLAEILLDATRHLAYFVDAISWALTRTWLPTRPTQPSST